MNEKRVILWVSLILICLGGCSSRVEAVTPPDEIEIVRLTYNDEWSDYEPVWSPDGNWILFKSKRVDKSRDTRGRDFFIMKPDGSGQRRLTDTTSSIGRILSAGSWSPDGTQITVEISFGGSMMALPLKIYTFPMIEKGSEPVSLEGMELLIDFGFSLPASDPVWSPDGEKLAFHYGSLDVLSHGGGSNIALLGIKSGEISKVTDESQMYAFELSWSPDNETIAFAGDLMGDDEIKSYIFMVEVSSGEITQLTFTGEEKGPEWSPDGKWIVYTGEEDYKNGLYLLNVDTGVTHKLIESEIEWEILCCASWSPDGEWIAFSGPMGNEYHDIYLLDMSWLEMEFE